MSLRHRMNWGSDSSDSSEEEDRCRRYFGRGDWDSSEEEDTPIKTSQVVEPPVKAVAKTATN